VGGGYQGYLLIENPNSASVQIGVSFRNPFGQSLVLQINGTPANSAAFSLPAQGAIKLRLEDPGNLIKTGWCQVFASQPVSGVLVYQYLSGGEILAEASVLPSPRARKFSVLVAQLGALTETGLALANPQDQSASIVLRRLTNDGLVIAETAFSLGPREQIARFVSQYFPGGIAILEGRVEILSNRDIVGVGLIYQNTLFTTVPVVPLP
jgi:hypothetical protein